MATQCPNCKSVNVRHSSARGSESAHGLFFSAYRCRDCRTRFWRVSPGTYSLVGMAGAMIILAGIIGWNAWDLAGGRPGMAEEGMVSTRFAEATKLAQSRDPFAEYRLAQMYLHGDGVPKDHREGQIWMERAAGHGHAEAQYAFAIALREGRGVIQDFERAAKLMHMAAANGHPLAQFELGLMYRAGTGIPADRVKAYVWLSLAAAQGVKGAVGFRDQVLRALSPQEVLDGQAEARRLNGSWSGQTATFP